MSPIWPAQPVDRQRRLCEGFARGGRQTGEVIREDMRQRRAVVTSIRLVPLAIQAQYLSFIFCLCRQAASVSESFPVARAMLPPKITSLAPLQPHPEKRALGSSA